MTDFLTIAQGVIIPLGEISLSAIRSQGAGGQNTNKVSSAIHLRFDIGASSLSDEVKERALSLSDSRISKDGVIIIKAQQFRTQEQNRADALARLRHLIGRALVVPYVRKPTKPTRSSRLRRLQSKARHGETKSLRKRVSDESGH